MLPSVVILSAVDAADLTSYSMEVRRVKLVMHMLYLWTSQHHAIHSAAEESTKSLHAPTTV